MWKRKQSEKSPLFLQAELPVELCLVSPSPKGTKKKARMNISRVERMEVTKILSAQKWKMKVSKGNTFLYPFLLEK